MTPASIGRLTASYDQLASRIGRMTEDFYARLFALRPEFRELFTGDMRQQRAHLAAALAMIVRNVQLMDALEEPLRELGAAHERAGVRPEHYPMVCETILAALSAELGDGWTRELAADWRELIETVARHMIAGSSPSSSTRGRPA